MTDLAKLVVRLEAETAKYQSELEKAKRQLAGFDKSVDDTAKRIGTGVGVAVTAVATGFAAMVKKSFDAADQLSKLAQSTGVSTEALSQLQYAAKLSGIDDLGGSLAKFNKTIGEAAEGSKAQTEAFARLGISVRDAKGNIRSTDDLLGSVADAFAATEDGAAKTKLAMDLFGRSGAQMIPMLNSGRAGLAGLRAEADAFGLTIGGETAKAAERFNDNLSRLAALATGAGNQIVAELAEPLASVTDGFVEAAKNGDGFRTVIKQVGPMAEDAAIGFAVAAESVFALGKLLHAVHGSFQSVYADLELFAKVGPFSHFGTGLIGAAVTGDLQEALDERNRVVEEANKRYIDLWNYNGTALSDALKVQFGHVKDVKQVTKDLIDAATGLSDFSMVPQVDVQIPFRLPGQVPNKLKLDYGVEVASGSAAKTKDAVVSMLDTLAEQAATLGYNERAMTLFRLANEGATESQIALATQLLDNIESYDKAQRAAAEYENEQKALDTLAEKYAGTLNGLTPDQQAFNVTFEDLNRLLDAGRISWEQYNNGVDAAQRKLEEVGQKTKDTIDQMSVYAQRAAENMQDAFADFLFDPFDRGLSGMLQSFAETLRRMAAEAAAADIFDRLLPKSSAGAFDFGALAANAASFFGGGSGGTGITDASFGGALADGGWMTPGQAYWVGEEGPELVLPRSAGLVMSHDESMRMAAGTAPVNVTVYTPDADSFRRSDRQIARELGRRLRV